MGTDGHRGLPFKWGPCSNGEFAPPPLSPVLREAQRRSLETAEVHARRLGMSRRQFLSTLSGAAVCLTTLSACANEEKRAATGMSTTTGGTFSVPTTATIDTAEAAEYLAGEEFIMDVQTHFVDEGVAGDGFFALVGSQMPFQSCEAGQEAGDPRVCFATDSYLDEMFLKSDTSLAVLSALPVPGESNPLSPELMQNTRDTMVALCSEDRVLMHVSAYPHLGDLGAALDAMTVAREKYDIAAWKIYTMVPGRYAYYLDDHDPARPQVGQALIDRVREVGPPIICTHKGLKGIVGSDDTLAAPTDIGPAASRNPDISFVVYHSGFEWDHLEGEYTEATADQGTNRLVKSLLDAGLEPNGNVYAELGGTWWGVMRDPERAAHVIGKLLKYVGEDRVVWGTDSIWFGTPQDQIQAMRTFEISEEFQERYGYPALTPEIKAKIFGLNSAALYGVDPTKVTCDFTREELQSAREEIALPPRSYGPETMREFARVLQQHGAMA